MENAKQEYERALEYIYDMMVSGELRIGSKLPTERAISIILGISRNSTREALSILHGMGLVERIQGSGNYISKDIDIALRRMILMMIALNGIKYREIRDYRRNMEKTVCRILIEKGITENQERELRGILNEMDLDNKEKLAEKDKEFHYKFVEYTGNNLLISVLEAISGIYQDMIKDIIKVSLDDDKIRYKRIHENILKYLVEGNEAQLMKAIDAHYNIIEEYDEADIPIGNI